jgi:hypothetical protein
MLSFKILIFVMPFAVPRICRPGQPLQSPLTLRKAATSVCSQYSKVSGFYPDRCYSNILVKMPTERLETGSAPHLKTLIRKKLISVQ